MELFEAPSPHVPFGVGSIDGRSRSQCNWCDYTSVSQTLMSTHERALHSAEMSASFFCTFCPAKLSSAVGLHLHTSRKHGVSHLPGWPTPSGRGKRNGDTVRPALERNLGDGWVVGDTREGTRVQYKADFYVNAFHTVGEGYVRLELLGKHRSGTGCISGNSDPTYLHELNRLLAESSREDMEQSPDEAEDSKADDVLYKPKFVESIVQDLQEQTQPLNMVADEQPPTTMAAFGGSVKDAYREGAGRGECRPLKEYFCASCSFRTKYSSSLRRHTAKMHKAENQKPS